MIDNYQKIVQGNLSNLYLDLPPDLARNMGAEQDGDGFVFKAFGGECLIRPDKILLDGKEADGVLGILISLYALNAHPDPCEILPFKAFKEFPDSMPYTGAFITHTEQVLAPHVEKIAASMDIILETLDGKASPDGVGGDFSFMVHALPKIVLCYIFYEADEDFPASATCLYSSNARLFLPVDGLADVGEYTSKKMISIAAGTAG
ncbi:DUF3786 domain-containing protein [Desulfospira joergensenii]|uniref:DUF3786 domain-containing protein n=1 Tax=Desulfospira joergensenii TaxID=53329 RepID=UPI0003B6639C|nr:DUF3786 domain-containing protein [Desulfospira joergensenii]